MAGAAVRAGALVLALVVAGCVGDADPDDLLGADADAALDEAAGNGTAMANLSFSAPAVDTTVWANYSMPSAASCPSGCMSNVTDISQRVPHGVPVEVRAVLRAEDGGLPGIGFMEVVIHAGDDAHVYRSSYSVFGDERVERYSLLARGSDAVEVEIFSSNPAPTEPREYSLEIRIQADPSVVPARVPAAFEAEAGATYEVRPEGAEPMIAAVYGPDDAPVAPVNGTEPARFTAEAAGEHVVWSDYGSANVTLVRVNATEAGALRPIGFEQVVGEFRPFVGPTTWTFEAAAAPVAVGVSFVSALPVQTTQTRDHVLIESSAGVVVDETVGCDGTCVGTGFSGAGISSQLADPSLVAGTYTVTLTPGGAEAALALHYVDRFDRTR